jgi:hypothetical protein
MEKILLRFVDSEGNDITIYTDSIYKFQFIDENTTKIFCDTPTSDGDYPTIYEVTINAVKLVEKIHGKEASELICWINEPPTNTNPRRLVDLGG